MTGKESATRASTKRVEPEKELQTREDKLLDLLLNNQIDQKSYERGLQLIRQGREEITNQLEALQKSLTSAVMETAKTVLELATSAKSLWIGRSTYERREFLNKVLSNPILDGLTVRYELKKPFAVLLKMNGNKEWCTQLEEFRTACVAWCSHYFSK